MSTTPSPQRLESLRDLLSQHLSEEFPHLNVGVEIRDGDLYVEAVPA